MNKQTLYANALAKRGSFLKVNIILMQRLGLNEAIMIREILRLKRHFGRLNQLSDEGFFYASYSHFADTTGLTQKQVVAAIKKLETLGIVKSNVTTRTEIHNGESKKLKTKYYALNTLKVDDYLKAGDGSVCMNTLDDGDEEDEGSFIIYSKPLAKQIGPVATILFSDMYSSFCNYEASSSLVEGEWFPNCQVKLAAKIGKTPKTICQTYMPQLKECGLIEVKQMGFPKTSYARICWDVFEEMLGFNNLTNSESNEEKITKHILAKAEELSGKKWVYNHHIVGHIEKRLKEGLTEEQILNMLEFMYDFWKDDPDIDKKFVFSYLCGSRCKDWIKKMDNEKLKDENDLALELTTAKICDAIRTFTKGEYSWEVSDARMRMIKRQLDSGVTEDELIDLAKNRYDHLKEHGATMRSFNWKNLFDENENYSCFNCIMAMRRDKNNNSKKRFKIDLPGKSRDGVSTKNDLRGKIDQADLRRRAAAGEAGIF